MSTFTEGFEATVARFDGVAAGSKADDYRASIARLDRLIAAAPEWGAYVGALAERRRGLVAALNGEGP